MRLFQTAVLFAACIRHARGIFRSELTGLEAANDTLSTQRLLVKSKADASNNGQLAFFGADGELSGDESFVLDSPTRTLNVDNLHAKRFVGNSLDFLGASLANAALENTTLDGVKHLNVQTLGILSESNEEVWQQRMAVVDAKGGLSSANLARWDDEKRELKVPAISAFSKSGLEVRSDLDLTSHALRNFEVEANTTLRQLRIVGGTIQDTMLRNVSVTDVKLGTVEMETLALSSLARHSNAGVILGVGDEGEIVASDVMKDAEGILSIDRDLTVTGSVLGSGPYVDISDSRLKKNIEPIGSGNVLDAIMKLKGVSYELDFPDHLRSPSKSILQTRQLGFIAQEVEQVFPDLVDTGADGYKGVQYSRFVPLLVEGLKELQAENNKLRKDLDNLSSRIAALEGHKS